MNILAIHTLPRTLPDSWKGIVSNYALFFQALALSPASSLCQTADRSPSRESGHRLAHARLGG